jgi:hypothetical protein
MAKITITEALAELKTVKSRIEKKRQHSGNYILRDSRAVDPMLKEGGSEEYVKREWQAIRDLEERFIRLRFAIQDSNLLTNLELKGISRCIAAWLIWRRELVEARKMYLTNISRSIQNGRRDIASAKIQNPPPGMEKADLIINLDEAGLLAEIEDLDETLGELDGRLSLLNATTTIDVA